MEEEAQACIEGAGCQQVVFCIQGPEGGAVGASGRGAPLGTFSPDLLEGSRGRLFQRRLKQRGLGTGSDLYQLAEASLQDSTRRTLLKQMRAEQQRTSPPPPPGWPRSRACQASKVGHPAATLGDPQTILAKPIRQAVSRRPWLRTQHGLRLPPAPRLAKPGAPRGMPGPPAAASPTSPQAPRPPPRGSALEAPAGSGR